MGSNDFLWDHCSKCDYVGSVAMSAYAGVMCTDMWRPENSLRGCASGVTFPD